MNTINQNFFQNGELTHDVPVTKSIFAHAGIFITIVFVLFLGSEALKLTSFTEGRHLSEQSASHNISLANNDHAGFMKF